MSTPQPTRTYLFLVSLVLLSGCSAQMGDKEERTAGADAPLCDAEDAALQSDTCSGQWLYTERVYRVEEHCEKRPTGCPANGDAPIFVRTKTVTEKKTKSLGQQDDQVLDPRGKPRIFRDTIGAGRLCDKYRDEVVAARQRQIVDAKFRSDVKGTSGLAWQTIRGRYHATCHVTVSYPELEKQSCECEHTATKNVLTSTNNGQLSSTGLTRAALEASVTRKTSDTRAYDVGAAECLTCDPQETIVPGARFACLSANVGKGDADTDAKIRDRQQTIYELYGHTLTEAQRTEAQATYDSIAQQFASCGALEAPSCLEGSAHARLANECSRLTAPHVNDELVAARMDVCMNALSHVTEVDGCNDFEASTAQSREIAELLAIKAIRYSAENREGSSAAKHAAAVRRTHYLAQWWKLAEKLSRFESDGITKAIESQSAVLEAYWTTFRDDVSLAELKAIAQAADTTESELQSALQKVVAESPGTRGALNALISTPSEGSYPLDTHPPASARGLEGEILLQVLSDALRNEAERADTLSGAHDLVCLFAQCAENQPATAMVKFWWTLAHLDAAHTSGDRFQSTDFAGLSSVLDAIRRGSLRERLTAALSEENDFGRGQIALSGLIQLGRTRSTSFANDGLFMGASARKLTDTLDAKGAARTAENVRIAADQFVAAHGQYDANVRTLLSAITADVGGTLNHQVTLARLDVLITKYNQLEARVSALKTAAARSSLSRSDLANDFAAIGDVLGETYTNQVGTTTTISNINRNAVTDESLNALFDGADATMQLVNQLAVWKQVGFPAERLVRIVPDATKYEYSPTCILRQMPAPEAEATPSNPNELLNFVARTVSTLDPDPAGLLEKRPMLSDGTGNCGPEGWTINEQNGTTQGSAVDYTNSASKRDFMGVKAEACVGSSTGATPGPTASVNACAYIGTELSTTSASNSSESTSATSSMTASVSDGIRSSKAPFGFAPVGALLLVIEKNGEIIDVVVANRNGISHPVPAGASAFLMVNDAYCAPNASDAKMTVDIGIFETESAAARATMNAIQGVMTTVRAAGRNYIREKSFSAPQQAALQADASYTLTSNLASAGRDSEDTIGKMRELFHKHLANEIARISTLVEVALLQDEMSIKAQEIIALGAEVRASTAQNRLNALLPLWAVRDIGTTKLQTEMNVLLNQVREQFMPLVQIWYPEYVNEMARKLNDPTNTDSPMRHLIAKLTPEADLGAVAADIKSAVVEDLFGNFDAARRASATGQDTNYIAVSIPNPKHADFETTWKSRFDYPTFDRATALDIWSKIEDGTQGTISIQPELVYGDKTITGTGYIDCRNVSPVIRKMMVSVVRPDSADLASRNALGRTVHVTFGDENWFATDGGLERYSLDDNGWYKMNIPVMDATEAGRDASVSTPNEELSRLVSRGAAGRDIGVSPFADITVDFRDWMGADNWLQLPRAPFDDDKAPPTWLASELVIVMEVDTQRSENREGLTWVSTCPDFGVN